MVQAEYKDKHFEKVPPRSAIQYGHLRYRLALVVMAIWSIPLSAGAACLVGGGLAGQNAAYTYVVSYVNSLYAADTGLKRISNLSKVMKTTDDYSIALASFSEGLRDLELAARDFECAASTIQPEEKFSPGGSSKDILGQTDLARMVARGTRLEYLKLAKEARAISNHFVSKMKGSIKDIEFAERMAKSSANLHDGPRTLFTMTSDVAGVLVDPKPDESNRMSRLRITTKERDDLIDMLDTAFGERIASQTKQDRPAFEASAALLRNWLATSGHTPLP